jgi:hypothetical protein
MEDHLYPVKKRKKSSDISPFLASPAAARAVPVQTSLSCNNHDKDVSNNSNIHTVRTNTIVFSCVKHTSTVMMVYSGIL